MSDRSPPCGTRIRVCFPFVGDEIGGSHVSAAKLVGALDRSRIDPVIVVQHAGGPVAAFLEGEGLRHVHLPLPAIPSPARRSVIGLSARIARTIPLIRRFLEEEGFDIVHTNDGRTHVNWGIAARLAGAKLVWHHRGDPEARGATYLAPLIAHQMVTVSRFSRPSRPVRPLADRLNVIHSPFEHPVAELDRADAKAALLAELDLPGDTRILGFVGGLIDRKRPLLFVEAVHRFRRQHPDIPVAGCLFGVPALGGTDFDGLARRRAEELGIADAIHLMGYRDRIETFMAAMDVLLVPAVGEPFGRTLIEAMLLGTPVVATNHGGNPEAIENDHNGYLVEPENADAFVRPIADLLSDPARFARIAGTARDEALRTYGTQVHVDQIMKVYARALATRKDAGLQGDAPEMRVMKRT